MSISILGVDGNPWTTRDMDASSNNVITTYHKLGFSGNYVSGGDTLDFTSIAGLVPSGALPVSIFVDGLGGGTTLSGAGGFYGPVAGAALNNAKLKIFKNTAGSTAEYSAGAYGADVTGDSVTMQVTWRKLLSN